ncbi:MAG: helix-hairpin-helix domain-containing protein [Chloroflexota bacterium]|jgi:DNA polymerase (family 10)
MAPREIRPPLEDGGPAGASLSNARVAAVLAEIADLLEIKGASSFKVGAYRRAADSVARARVEVAEAYRAGEAPRLRGVGGSISERIAELAATGRLAYHEALRAEVPPTLLELLAIPGVGPRTAGEVWRSLGVATLAELESAAREGRLRAIRGLSARSEARIIESIGELERRPPQRLRLGQAHALAERVVALIETLPEARRAVAAGSVRRWRETVGDLDMLVETDAPRSVLAALRAHPLCASVEPPARAGADRAGADRASLQLVDGPQLDVMTMPPGASGSYLVHFTGSAAHNVALRHRARERGWSLSEHGLVPLGDEQAAPLTFADEASLYAFLELAEIPPELREGRGEVEAAASGTLPRLVEPTDLRGDCHSHSNWSDGREPLETMVESARGAGREYQVLTDHSQSLTIANGLSPTRVEAQRRLVGELNERFARELAAGELPQGAHPGGFVLLHGTELEITIDGRLDYEDSLLAAFDVVVASLHVGRRQPRPQLMQRYELAMRSPHVDIISHPSGRQIGRRPDLDLDWDAFYRLAAETGTLLEINGSEARLDLDEQRIMAATEAGCRFVIDSDAHERSEWRHLVWGTHIARRAWVTPELVANTLPREEFVHLMREKPHRC